MPILVVESYPTSAYLRSYHVRLRLNITQKSYCARAPGCRSQGKNKGSTPVVLPSVQTRRWLIKPGVNSPGPAYKSC